MAGNDYNNRGAGPNFVPAYQISGVPYVTSSDGNNVSSTPQRILFPYVTRFFQVTNTSEHTMRIGFTIKGIKGEGASVSGSNYERGIVAGGADPKARCKNYIVLSGSLATSQQNTVMLELRCKELYVMRDGDTDTGFSLVAGLTGVDSAQFPVLTGSNGFAGVG